MKYIYLILIGIGITFNSCEKSNFPVGKKEFLTFKYSNYGVPEISESPTDQSNYVVMDSASATDLGNGTVQIVIEGIRVQTVNKNFELKGYSIQEMEDTKWEDETEFKSNPSEFKTDIAAVLVLDMSESLEKAGLIENVKDYAKSFVDYISQSTPDSRVAVVFFSGKRNISITPFYTSAEVNVLKSTIDTFSIHVDRTALYEATLTGINLLESLNFRGSKSLVVFSDGGDNDTDNSGEKKSLIQSDDHFRIAIGLEGTDFRRDDLKAMSSSDNNFVVAKDADDLKKVFEEVALQVGSVYKIVYSRSDQTLSSPIHIKFNLTVENIAK